MDILGPFPIAPYQLKFLIIGVDYLTKWIEAKVESKIIAERVCRFYWQMAMCMFDLIGIIVSYNGTRFAITTMVDFYNEL